MHETLISGNTAASQGPELSNNSRGTVNANRFNLFGFGGVAGVTPNFSPGATDLVPGEPLTAILDTALRNNGGPTTTHALAAGSPAIDAAGTCFPQTDQRGIPRPQDADGDGFPDCDIGAFEIGVALPPPPPPAPPPPPPLPDARVINPNVPIPCGGSNCNVRIECTLVVNSGTPCANRIDLFVRAAAARLSEDRLTKTQRRIRFAFGVANVPPAQTAKVKLKLTKKGKDIFKRKRGKKLKGVLEIRNAAGTAASSTPTRIRLR